MKKIIAITLLFLFSATGILSSAFGYSDCAARCAYEMAKAHQHAAMDAMDLAAPNCCSGMMKNACEMAGIPEVKIPECSMLRHRHSNPDPTAIGFISVNRTTGFPPADQTEAPFNTGQTNKTPPIYLQTLSILR